MDYRIKVKVKSGNSINSIFVNSTTDAPVEFQELQIIAKKLVSKMNYNFIEIEGFESKPTSGALDQIIIEHKPNRVAFRILMCTICALFFTINLLIVQLNFLDSYVWISLVSAIGCAFFFVFFATTE